MICTKYQQQSSGGGEGWRESFLIIMHKSGFINYPTGIECGIESFGKRENSTQE